MKKIYSKVKDGLLLHIVFRKQDFLNYGRINVSPDDQFLQLAALSFNNGKTFSPHKHIVKDVIKKTCIAQESWVVIEGKVEAVLYDIDDKIISKDILRKGDISMTFEGGHTYVFLEDNSLVYEYKTGPYEGQDRDKVFIDEQ